MLSALNLGNVTADGLVKVNKLPPSVVAPRVVLAVAALASSISERPKDVRVASAAVPKPVKYGTVSAADVSPAIAVSSASCACTFVPITRPRLLLVVEASVT